MLSIGKLSLGQEAYYLEEVLDGAEDYYVNVGEAPGRWLGSGAAQLGLEGKVEAEDLRAVLAGTRPGGDGPLRSTAARLPGVDLTLSAPKSMSLVWGLGDAETAQAVVDCHERGVDAAITYLESHACHVRRGHGGVDVQAAHGFVAAAFRHRTSRVGDPALHTHVLLANLAEGRDGRWTALDTRHLYRQARTAGFVYQAVLRYELARSLGLLFEEVEQGHADVAGVPESLRREFSNRRRQIVEAMERHGTVSAKGAQAATLDTRRSKAEHVPEPELRRRWVQRAEPFAFSVDELPRLRRDPTVVVDDQEIAGRVTERHATFERRDVVRAAAQAATQGASLEDLEGRADAFLVGAHVVAVAEAHWTTPEMLALEERTVELAVAGHGSGRAVVSGQVLDAAVEARPSLGDDQRRAVHELTTSGNSVDVLVGPAGTGKTFSLDAARDAWVSSGHRVLGTALAARAAAELRHGAGIASQTADRLLLGLAQGREHLDERTVVVVDEAGMLGTRRLAALVAEADAVSAKVVLVGDPKQLPEIDAGGLFASLAGRLGHSELSENRRQRDPQERAVAEELRAGQVERAVSRLERHGRITTADNADLLRDGLVGDWYAARASGEDVVMVASRRSTVADLNERAREFRMARGEIGETVLEENGLSFAVSDEVLAHHNDYRLGILNSDRGVVRSATSKALAVELAGGRVVEVPVDYISDGHLTHGYAATVHKTQGISCDSVLVLGDDTFTIETGYTSLTRAKLRNQLYLVAPESENGHGLGPELDPVASFTAALQRSDAKTAAIDVVDPPVLEP
ncbi:MAG: relaxase domain-containing protein [Actinomycetota bacterium]|nr:relaxase domain-containing protein [Actinomycetota bacterium]